MNTNSDNQLVKLSLKDPDNFAHLMQKYETPLLVYIHRLTKTSTAEAEDILQEVFIKTYQNLNDFDQNLKFSSWIYRITHNQVISHYRKQKETLSLEDNELIFQKLKSEVNIPEEIDKKILKESIHKLLKKLDPKYRDVLILKYLEDKDYTEISNILQKPMGTIATLLNRAKEKFKNLLT